jgi:hypothetical protein
MATQSWLDLDSYENTSELYQGDGDLLCIIHHSQRELKMNLTRHPDVIAYCVHPTVNPTRTLLTLLTYLRLVGSICSSSGSSRSSRHLYRLAIGHINGRKLLSGFSHIRDPPRASSAIAGLVNRKASLVASPFAVHRKLSSGP